MSDVKNNALLCLLLASCTIICVQSLCYFAGFFLILRFFWVQISAVMSSAWSTNLVSTCCLTMTKRHIWEIINMFVMPFVMGRQHVLLKFTLQAVGCVFSVHFRMFSPKFVRFSGIFEICMIFEWHWVACPNCHWIMSPTLLICVHQLSVLGFYKQTKSFPRISTDSSRIYLSVSCEWTIANYLFVNYCASAIFVSMNMIMAMCENYY